MNFHFGWNDWFFIITSFGMFLLFLPIRNYFPRVLVIVIWIFNIAFVSTIDYFLLATPFRLYIFGDNATYEWPGALFHLLMYPAASIIFLYGYDKFGLYGKKLIWYILFWTVFSLLFESFTVKNHALTYLKWKWYYSIPAYPIAAGMLILLFHFTKKKLLELSVPELQ